jgi:CDP-glycerol glycerophosphotransferase
MCDYVLLDRPILLYAYDYDDYTNHRGIYYDSLEDIAPGPIFYSAKDLINAIENIEEISKKYESKAEKIKDFFNKYKDGNSSERLLTFLRLI